MTSTGVVITTPKGSNKSQKEPTPSPPKDVKVPVVVDPEAALKQKEKKLEEQLRAKHCRPLLRLFKMMSTDGFKADFAEGNEDELN